MSGWSPKHGHAVKGGRGSPSLVTSSLNVRHEPVGAPQVQLVDFKAPKRAQVFERIFEEGPLVALEVNCQYER